MWRNKRPFEKLLFRNLAMLVLPLCLMFALAALMLGFLQGSPRYSITEISDTALAEDLYAGGDKNVKFVSEQMTPSGIEYRKGKKKLGSYFFAMKERRLYLFLLPASLEDRVGDGETGFILKAALREEPETAELFQTTYAELLDVSPDSLSGYISPVIIDVIHYPGKTIRVIRIGKNVLLFGCLVLAGYLFLAAVFPGLNMKRLSFSRGGFTNRELNRALGDELLFYNGRLAISEKILFRLGTLRTEAVRLSSVKKVSLKDNTLIIFFDDRPNMDFHFRDEEEAEEAERIIRGAD